MSIAENISFIRDNMEAAAKRSGRVPSDIALMGVSKYHTLSAMLEASPWLEMLGENKVQDAAKKRLGFPSDKLIPWHLIGHLQKNKVRKALEIFDVIQTIDSLELACTVERVLCETGKDGYPVLIEVNMSGEASKHGIKPIEAEYLLERMMVLCPHIAVTGLMTIGPNVDDALAIRKSFEGLRNIRDSLRGKFGLALTELSMGMSQDYETAIEEGSTIVRIGSAIFGARDILTKIP